MIEENTKLKNAEIPETGGPVNAPQNLPPSGTIEEPIGSTVSDEPMNTNSGSEMEPPTPEKPPKEEDSKIEEAYNAIEYALMTMESEVTILEKKLEPVLKHVPDEVAPGKNADATVPTDSPFSVGLRTLHRRVSNLAQELHVLNDRCEL